MKKDMFPTTWNFQSLFSTDNDPKIKLEQEEITRIVDKFTQKWQKHPKYLKDPKLLRRALDEYEQRIKTFGTGGVADYYFSLRLTQDQNNPELKAKVNKTESFTNKIRNQVQFFTLNLAQISAQQQQIFLATPDLVPYRHFLEQLFAQAKYLLSDQEEKIINLKRLPAHTNWVNMVSGFLTREERDIMLKDGKARKNFSEILGLLNDKNKQVRDEAALVFNDILSKYVDVAEAELNAVLENKKVDDELRGLPRPDSARHLQDDIDTQTVDTLVAEVSLRYDLSARFYKLKAKLLNVSRLEYHERNIEVGDADINHPYKKALEIILKSFSRLDPEFERIVKGFISNGQIDVYPKPGKRNGAFCASGMITQPTFILLNYTSQLKDVLTAAHEFGHGINAELMKKSQNALNFGTPLSTAEVASTLMEDFCLEEIMSGAGDKLRLSLIMSKLNDDISTIFRQIAAYCFELQLHSAYREKGYLSKEEIGKLFQKHMASYMGKYVRQSPGSENWWVYWQHFRSFFYNYSYASGLLISKSLQRMIRQDPGSVTKIKEFLSAGSSDSPKNIFAKLGIAIADPKFWQNGLREIDNLLSEAEKLAEKLGKI